MRAGGRGEHEPLGRARELVRRETLDRDDALAIARHLERPRKTFGVSVRIKDMQWDAAW